MILWPSKYLILSENAVWLVSALLSNSYEMFKLSNIFAIDDSDAANEKAKRILYLHITTKSAANQLCFAQQL